MKHFLRTLVLVLSTVSVGWGQVTDDYRTTGAANFVSNTNWERFDGTTWVAAAAAPTAVTAQAITIRSPHTATVTASVSLDQLVVESGGTLQVNAVVLTIANGTGDDLTVNGTLITLSAANLTTTAASRVFFADGSLYNFQNPAGGSIANGANVDYDAGSTLLIAYTGTTTTFNFPVNESFGSIEWNTPGQNTEVNTGGTLGTGSGVGCLIQRDLILTETGTGAGVRVLGTVPNATYTLTVPRNLVINDVFQATDDVNRNLDLAIGGNLSFGASASIVENSNATCRLIFNGSTIQTITGNFPTAFNFDQVVINAGSTVNAGTNLIQGTPGRTFVLNGTLQTLNINGFSGGVATTVTTAFTTITLGAASTVDYAADAAQTVTNRVDYANLTLSGATAPTNKTLGSGNLSLSGTFTVEANNTFVGGAIARNITVGTAAAAVNSFAGTGSLDLSGAAHTLFLNAPAPVLLPTNNFGTLSIVNFSRTGTGGDQDIPVASYARIQTSGNGIKRLLGNTTATRRINLARPLNLNGFTLTIGDNSFTAGDVASAVSTTSWPYNGTVNYVVNDITATNIVIPISSEGSIGRNVTLNFAAGGSNNPLGATVSLSVVDVQFSQSLSGLSNTTFPLNVPGDGPGGGPDDPAYVDGTTSGEQIALGLNVSNLLWTIECATCDAGETYSITLNANGLENAGGAVSVSNPLNLRIIRRANSGSAFSIPLTFSTAIENAAGNYDITHTGLSGFSQFGVGVIGETTVLPVSWVGISARREAAAGAEVSWSVARELNNERFEVQRSSSERFASYTTVATLPGRGTSDQAYTYRITDADAPTVGRTYYRIRQVDFDGTSSLSPIAALDGVGNWSVYPNPITGPLSVVGVGVTDATEPVAVQLLSNDGRLLVDAVLPAAQLGARLDAALVNAAAGLYMIRVGGRTVRVVKP